MQYYKQIYLIIKAFASIFFHTLPPKLKKNNYAKNTAMPIVKKLYNHTLSKFLHIKLNIPFNLIV